MRQSLQRFIARQMRKRPRVYLRPTIAGLWWLGTLFILFLVGWGYRNNLCLGIAMLLVTVTVVFLMEAHFNLEGLKVTRLSIEDQFAGRPAPFRLWWESRKNSQRRNLTVHWDGNTVAQSLPLSSFGGLGGDLQGAISFPLRGHFKSATLKLTSTYPLGLFQVWCYHRLDSEAWIYPEPSRKVVPWEGDVADAENENLRSKGDGEEPGEFRAYGYGDPPARVAWKVVARGLPPHTKTFESPQSERRRYLWPWGAGGENERSILAGSIQASFEAGETWSLATAKEFLPWGEGHDHRKRGLRLLTEAP